MTNNVHNFTRDLPWNKQKGSDGGGGSMEARIARLESDVEYIKRDIGEIKIELKGFQSNVDGKFAGVNEEFKSVNEEFKSVRAEMRSQFYWLIGVRMTVAAALFGTMAWGFTTIISLLPS